MWFWRRVWFWHIISTHCDPLCDSDSGDITYSLWWFWRHYVFVYYGGIKIRVWFWHIISTHCGPLCDSGDITYSLWDSGETLRIHCVILEVLSIRVWFWHIISTHCDPLCDSGDITYSLFDYGGIKYSWMILWMIRTL